jgi:nucleoside-diphosphate-sugar epimerase
MTDIVVTGATGVIGHRAVRELLAAGHRVAGVTRSARGTRRLEGLGARALEADVFDQASLTAAFAGAEVVVNLLTHVPAADAMSDPGAWDEHNRLRREASALVARAAAAAGAGRLVQESVALVYADGGDAWLDEHAPVSGGAPTAAALTAETNASVLFPGDTVVLRFGIFIGPDSALTRANIEAARAGISTSLGRRDAYRATVWLDDAGAAVRAAVGAPAGIYNVVDDEPPTVAEMDAALAAAVGSQSLRPAMDEVPPDAEPLARSQRVSNRRLRGASDWTPRVRGGTDGWRLIVTALK